jgi:hypothetical protein
MSDRRLYVLTSREKRRGVVKIVAELERGSRVEIKGPKRTLPQNDLMWLWLTAYADQATWHGEKLAAGDWKDLFSGALKAAKNGLRIVPGLQGGFMVLGLRTSDMTVAEMAELITYLQSEADRFGVVLDDDGKGGGAANNRSAEAA